MSFLAINGVELSVRDGTLKQDVIEIGERGRSFDGTAWASIRAIKQRWTFQTKPMSQSEADCWKALLGVSGHTAAFEDSLYTAQGLACSSSFGASIASTSGHLYAAALKLNAGSSFIQFPYMYPRGCTAGAWVKVGPDVFRFQMLSSRNGGQTITYFLNGVANPQGKIAYNGGIRINGDNALDVYVNDLIMWPGECPDIWAANYYTHLGSLQVARLPNVRARGDAIRLGFADYNKFYIARVIGSRIVQCYIDGSFSDNAEELEVELIES